MLKIKMSRVGKRKQPTFRLLVVEHQKDPWGTYIENVGHFNPREKQATMVLNADRIKYWMSVGAQPTDTVHNLLITAGLIEGKKRNVSKLGKIARDERTKAADDAKKGKMEAAAKAKAEKEAAAAPKEAAPAEAAPTEEKKA
ncbi:MAG: 30S ribosomal protein S16 [Parcubacteria group bacterium]|nr:30S ribosomal protein S16 [Parcubacteria group bacterium]